MSFANKTIVLTGASSGIGRSLQSPSLSRASLVLGARNQVALEETVAACAKQEGKVIAVPTDVTQPEPCQQLIEQAIAAFGQIDVLVNNAGISMLTRFGEITDLSIFEQVMQVNYLGAVYCTHYARPISKPIEDFWWLSLHFVVNRSSVQVMLQVNTPCKASLILSALSYGKWSGCVGCVTGVCCNRYPTKGFRSRRATVGAKSP